MDIIRYVCNEICCTFKLYFDLITQFLSELLAGIFKANKTGL